MPEVGLTNPPGGVTASTPGMTDRVQAAVAKARGKVAATDDTTDTGKSAKRGKVSP